MDPSEWKRCSHGSMVGGEVKADVPFLAGDGSDTSNDWVTSLGTVGGIGRCDLYEFVGAGNSACGGCDKVMLLVDVLQVLVVLAVVVLTIIVVASTVVLAFGLTVMWKGNVL